MRPSLCSWWNPRLPKWPFTTNMPKSCWWRILPTQTWRCASMTVSRTLAILPRNSPFVTHDGRRACRREDAQDVGAGASGGEEREVVHGEGWGGAERPEPREPAVRGAVWRGPQHVSGSGGRHHDGGAAQHQERPFLPHHHWQVGQCRHWHAPPILLYTFALFGNIVFCVPLQETSQSELPVPAITFAAAPNSFTSPGSTDHSFSKSHMLPLYLRPVNSWIMVISDSTCLQMISYDGSDFTTASVSKKSSPVVQSAGKVIKSIFVPNVGWASQVSSGDPV